MLGKMLDNSGNDPNKDCMFTISCSLILHVALNFMKAETFLHIVTFSYRKERRARECVCSAGGAMEASDLDDIFTAEGCVLHYYPRLPTDTMAQLVYCNVPDEPRLAFSSLLPHGLDDNFDR